MDVPPSTREHLDGHLGQAEFELRVAGNFECLRGTPAHDQVREALARVADARRWLRETVEVRPAVRPKPLPLGQGLPFTRQERLGYRWPDSP